MVKLAFYRNTWSPLTNIPLGPNSTLSVLERAFYCTWCLIPSLLYLPHYSIVLRTVRPLRSKPPSKQALLPLLLLNGHLIQLIPPPPLESLSPLSLSPTPLDSARLLASKREEEKDACPKIPLDKAQDGLSLSCTVVYSFALTFYLSTWIVNYIETFNVRDIFENGLLAQRSIFRERERSPPFWQTGILLSVCK